MLPFGLPRVLGEPALFRELFQMRLERQCRRRAELRRGVGPGGVEELVAGAQAGVERLHEAALAVEAVGDVLVELCCWVADVGPVAWAEHLQVVLAPAHGEGGYTAVDVSAEEPWAGLRTA